MKNLGRADIGLCTFLASAHPSGACGTNGLPVTPNSIKIYGRFQELKQLSHPNICQYIDIVRGNHERIVVISEHYQDNLLLSMNRFVSICEIKKLTYDIIVGLEYLHSCGYVHRNLSPCNILLDCNNRVKLSCFGLYHMTAFGDSVLFPIGDNLYMSPEVVASGIRYNSLYGPSNASADIWSLGLVLLDCYLEGKLWGKLRDSPAKIAKFLIDLLKKNQACFNDILKVSEADEKVASTDENFISFLSLCLTVNPTLRPSVYTLLNHKFLSAECDSPVYTNNRVIGDRFPELYRSANLQMLDFNKMILEANAFEEDHLSCRSIIEVYHLWCLAGGDIFNELKKQQLIKTKPSIVMLPTVVLCSGEDFGMDNDQALHFDGKTISVSLHQLRHRLSNINPTAYYPLVIEDDLYPTDTSETAKLPLIIKENNVEYQFHRIVLFDRLLNGYPHSRERLVKEARIDISPLVRAKVWAVLLNVTGDIFSIYDRIDKESFTTTDRQIEVDIPRCHQYNHLLASPTAHNKLKRILKAWVVSQEKLVYWQGLDSLCAPFLTLNFNNEALAYACLSAFISKYLYNFFLKDNSKVIQEYLAIFSQFIAFHEPDLFNHLNEIGFVPELYAIPWFLTMFSHVFPLQKIYYLWDTLLLGNSMLPLCIGVSILIQFKDQLLSYGFNECILLFSDMPSIDIERCVKDSIKLFNCTPPSAGLRKEDNPTNRVKAPAEEQFMNLPEKEFIPLAQLKGEVCLRISSRDLVRISSLIYQQSFSSTNLKEKFNQMKKSKLINGSNPLKSRHKKKVLVVDLRVEEDFLSGHLPNSVNIPFKTVVNESNQYVSSPATAILEANKGCMILILGPKGLQPMVFGQLLVSRGYRRVCVMDGSANTLKGLGYFTAV
ncbi:TBC domain-containing protein kinase-like protein [Hydra vulgaris]|uniref:TBC domain-containing protein kinase-like protein n=1 Tax=Hydra vulgaris TaxID=6087 RepID=A0ABM4CVA7_HYDVU